MGKKSNPDVDAMLDWLPESARETILQEADRLVHGDRQGVYGHPFDDFSKTASLWSAVLGMEVTPEQVALCMIMVKISRLMQSPDHRDTQVDVGGYIATYNMVREERHRRGLV